MPITIVSIEDESEIAELLTLVLGNPEIEVIGCETAHEGLAMVRRYRPALVIIDIMLPDMDGWSVYDEIRADPDLYTTPIIILTALRREFQPRRNFGTNGLNV